MSVYDVIRDERNRQVALRNAGKFKHTPAEGSLMVAVAMLTEEVGEVAQAALAVAGETHDGNDENALLDELIHVAAVAVAMVEGITRKTLTP